MGSFPWLIDYGYLVWPWLGLVFLLFWWLLWHGVGGLSAWFRQRLCLRRLGSPVAELSGATGAVVAVDGVVELDGEPVQSFDGNQPVAATSVECKPEGRAPVYGDRCAQLSLQTCSGRVQLMGPLRIGAGSRDFRPLERLWALDCRKTVWRALKGQMTAHQARWAHLRIRDVSAGDRIRVVGRVGRRPATGNDYRSPAGQWVISPSSEDGGALDVGLVGGRVLRPHSYRWKLTVVCTGLLAAAALSSLTGRALLRQGRLRDDPTRLQLAAAMPFQRADARSTYANWLEVECVLRTESLLDASRPWEARARLRGCPRDNAERILSGVVDQGLADYGKASDELAGARFDEPLMQRWVRSAIATHISAHRYDRALRVARAWENLEPKPERRCLRLMLAYRVGDSSVADELRGLARSKNSLHAICWALGYEMDPDIVGGRSSARPYGVREIATLLDAERAPESLGELDEVERYGSGVSDGSLFAEYGTTDTPIGLYRSAYRALDRSGDRLGTAAQEIRAWLAVALKRAAESMGDESSTHVPAADPAVCGGGYIWPNSGAPAGWAIALRKQREIARACGGAAAGRRYTPVIQAHYRATLDRNDSLLYWALSRAY